MNNTVYTLDDIITLLAPVFADHRIRKAVLFDSYAKGCADARSDVDILVDSGLKGLSFFGLLEDVNNALGKEVDMLDVTQITPDSEIDHEIEKSGVLIYEYNRYS
ncbi:MAG: nucleotidyltransferase domain-containing protein [Ruminococcus sp.]|nr:nucleotidyltransferase domain-containing protein [Ruminococcus sp.]